MSEITKLYENCNIKPKQEGHCDWDSDCPYPRLKCNDECPYWKDEDEAKYPPFNAEKQIELIKWLILNYSTEITKGRYTNYFMSTGRSYKASGNDDLIICMANLINNLWQDLTEEEKQQIKEILE